MPDIEVRCPSCLKKGKIEITDDSIKSISRGLLAVNVAPTTVCPHSFLIYVDKNLNIRDYFIPDFQIELPHTELEEALKDRKIPGIDIIDLDLIKLNLTPSLLTYIIRAIFYKRKIVLILEQKYLYNHILNFFEYITQNSFEANITITSKENYYNNKEQFNDFIIFEGTHIINDKDEIIQPKKLQFEKSIIEQFLSESKSTLSLVLLKNEIKKSFAFAKSISEFIISYNQKEKLSSKIITDYLKDAHGFKIEKNYKKYLNWLLDLANEYFGISLYESSEATDFLEFI